MTSRLDRLFILLESGSSAVTRRAAAKQIGDVQKLYPHELHTLLNRLISYLHSSCWDTRIAASQTVEAILINVPKWKPELQINSSKLAVKREIKKEEASINAADEENSSQSNDSSATTNTTISTVNSENNKDLYLSFAKFNLEQVLSNGARLTSSEGMEFDFNDEASGSSITTNDSAAERLTRQRILLNEKLGLTQASKLGVNLTDIISDEDVIRNNSNYNTNEDKVPVEHILNIKSPLNPEVLSHNGQQLSCREINRAKRKARQNALLSSVGGYHFSACNEEPEKKKSKATENSKNQEIYYSLSDPVPDVTNMWIDAVHWPLDGFCGRLYIDLFNPKWEVRHGAATALRELINHHGAGAGKTLYMSQDEMELYHNMWLEDACVRLICVLCLDRFGDFISDQVVAPVRETCAQVLGTVVKGMPASKVNEVVHILRSLLKEREWEVRHGGLLGLKYIFVVREDLLPTYLPQTLSDILGGLFDKVDDVGAVAASTLTPVASWFPKLLNATEVSSIVKMLWDLLLHQDELTSACNNFMSLLAAILCLPNASQWIQMEPMSELIPRLWPFLTHSTSSVRKSTLITLQTLTSNVNRKPEEIKKTNEKILEENTFSFDSKNLKLNFGVVDWPWKLLQDALRHVYQRILVEPIADIQQLAKKVWINLIENSDLGALLHAACPFVSSWMCLAMQPPRLAFDPSVLIYADSANSVVSSSERKPSRGLCDWAAFPTNPQQHKLYLGGSESTPWEIREQNYMRARILAAESLGLLSKYLIQPAPGIIYTEDTENPVDCYVKVLLGYLNSKSAVQRIVCSLIIGFWAQNDPSLSPGPKKLRDKLHSCVMECMYYDEVAVSCTRLLQEAHDLIATFTQYMVPINDVDHTKVLTLEEIDVLTTKALSLNLSNYSLKAKISETLDNRRKSLQNSLQQTSSEQNAYNINTQAALAGAIICLNCLPEKLNPVVRPLMESIKREECLLLQELSAEFLVLLMAQVCDRNPSPNAKIFTNLCTLLKSDAEFTPKISKADLSLKQTPVANCATDSYKCIYYGILSLSLQQQSNNSANSSKVTTTTVMTTTAASPRGPGRPPLHESISQSTIQAASCSNEEQEMLKYCRIQRLGATCAISRLFRLLGNKLIENIPIVEQLMFTRLKLYVEQYPNMNALSDQIIDVIECNDLVTTLQLLETAAPFLHNNLHELLFQSLDALGIIAGHPLKSLRHMTARCIASLADIDPPRTMNFVVNRILILLGKIGNIIERQGGIEVVQRIAERLHIKIVPYIVVLVVPLLGCMSDPDECIRLLATHCFATLVQLMPLDDGIFSSDSRNLCESEISNNDSKDLESRRTQDRQFLQYLFNPKSIPDYRVPVALSVTLRNYQQAGVNWLWFLNKYNLHGILCDDMGLGKTLQTICIISGDHFERQHNDNAEDLPSLVICPPTLTGHWVYEIEKFLQNSNVLRPLHYVGLPSNREFLRTRIGKKFNLVVSSYDAVRKDIDFISRIHWNYCVLDEGHIIKNSKTKSSKAIKLVKAKHRLILSGTPIQNNVLELWSLFDFLMPGFLGTEREFIARYSRPILASREAKSSRKDQEAGVLAMESLHRQVLPFLLRRVKEDVLNDLPPKITQDLLCELSPLQERLYEDFSRLHLNADMTGSLNDIQDNKGSGKGHIFYALRYLQNVCNHPKLVLNPKHPEYVRVEEELSQQQSNLDDIQHSAKLPALKQLLLDCGIGIQTESVSHHRALIFCQLKAMLDIVEKDLLQKHLPSVTYLRLDGSVPASMRHDIVQNFNMDPSIDVLLLTTQVGGLGLNLTGADTVIFVEHDWNPMKDLQAMDRAHRIGQKKVVNVYRLITRKSLEEKIMCLQKFKLLTANTIVSTENASLDTMATGQILDLFNLGERNKNERKEKSQNTSNTSEHLSLNAIIENLPELWSEQQYDEEYDLSNFIQTLRKSS